MIFSGWVPVTVVIISLLVADHKELSELLTENKLFHLKKHIANSRVMAIWMTVFSFLHDMLGIGDKDIGILILRFLISTIFVVAIAYIFCFSKVGRYGSAPF